MKHGERPCRPPSKEALGQLPLGLFCLGAALVSGCSHSGSHHGGSLDVVPVYYETEPNDFVEDADDFGVLYADELFWIEGRIADASYLPYDPFDGFAFRSAAPLFVAFTLFVDDPYAELRVGLYDPYLDETVAYWYQGGGTVYGEIDVYAGGTDFHLFVEPLYGATTYGIEIESFYLYGATAADESVAALARASATERLVPKAAQALTEDERAAGERYGGPKEEGAREEELDPIVGRTRLFVLDLETGEVSESSFLVSAGGTWMGIPAESPTE